MLIEKHVLDASLALEQGGALPAAREVPELDALPQLLQRAAAAGALIRSSQERSAELHRTVGLAKGRLSLGDEVAHQLQALQKRAHERSVGAFERLLSAILEDVLPGQGAVRLDLAMKNNSTWLDVLLERDGFLESVLEGNGGAVANVLSAGLRFAALSRSNNRRVLVLDEPDCWLKPDRVPAFVNVIAKVSQAAGFQTFFVSHHDPELFEHAVNVIELGQDPDGTVKVLGESHAFGDWDSEDLPGIRALRLQNVRRHTDTTLRFRPGATAIVGANNLGKSTALLGALKAVAYGESSDDLIRHGCDEAQITLDLESGKRIEWSRRLKRNPVVLYRFSQHGKTVAEGRPGKRSEAPVWVAEQLGISRLDELDVQLRSQKQPVFLLDDTASRRAQVLSIGQESGYLTLLMEEYEKLKTQDRETVRQGEAELARLAFRLKDCPPVGDLETRAAATGKLGSAVASSRQSLALLAQTISKLDRQEKLGQWCEQHAWSLRHTLSAPAAAPVQLGALVQSLQLAAYRRQKLSSLPSAPVPPTLASPSPMLAAYAALARAARLRAVAVPAAVDLPQSANPASIVKLGLALSRWKKLAPLLSLSQEIKPPLVTPPRELLAAANSLGRCEAEIEKYTKQKAQLSEESNALGAEVEAFHASIGGRCPLCHSSVEAHELLGEHGAHLKETTA